MVGLGHAHQKVIKTIHKIITTFLVIGCGASLIVIFHICILCFNSSRPSSQQRRNAGKEVMRFSVEKRAKLSGKDLQFDRFLIIITIQDGAFTIVWITKSWTALAQTENSSKDF